MIFQVLEKPIEIFLYICPDSATMIGLVTR